MNRKKFIYGSLVGLGTAIVLPTYFLLSSKNEHLKTTISESNQFNKNLIKDFVVAGHSKLKLVKEMLAEYPNLIYTAYDWGNGDYEQAIEGAAHLGNKDIVTYLINKGARPNLFALTMLGKTNFVKPIIESYPELLFSKGAHGLTLLHHAQVGNSKELEDYFVSKGLTERMLKIR